MLYSIKISGYEEKAGDYFHHDLSDVFELSYTKNDNFLTIF